jgi:diadenosine tetraphosphate (Ap4A) HIT family hydrolase
MVIVLKRHASALHELSPEEFRELGHMLLRCSDALHHTLATQKEYLLQFAEAEHFRHVHLHLVPIRASLPSDLRGAGIMAALGPPARNRLTVDQITTISQSLREALASRDG